MKALVKLFLLLPLVMCLACEDVVIGECPIAVIGDTIYVIPLETDKVQIDRWTTHGDVTVTRNYKDEGYTVTFYEDIGRVINKIILTLPSGNAYVWPVIREIGDDGFRYWFDFTWSGEDY